MLNTLKSESNKEIEREATRQKVVNTATEMFVKQGCKKVTMDYIAMNMHISKRTIYELFKDKETLLILCVKQLVKQADDSWAFIREKTQEPMVVIMLMMHSMNAFISNYAKLIDDIDHYYPSIRLNIFNERPIHNEEFIKQQLTEAQKRGTVRANVDIHITTQLLINIATLVNSLHEYDAATRSYIVSELTFNYLRGIMSLKTIQDYNSKEEEFHKIIKGSEAHKFNSQSINIENIKIL